MTEPRYTASQTAAIDISGPPLDTCIVAGPGSGKTTVLVEYFRRLVGSGIDPLRILAITFTEKAAANMRQKLAEAFEGESATRGKLERAWVSTVHGFCARLLRENAVFAGVDPEFSVADERESWRLQQESMAAAIEELFTAHADGVRALIRGLSSFEFETAVLSAYDAMRGAGVPVERLAAFPAPGGTTRAELETTLAAIAAEPATNWNYQQKQQLVSGLEGGRRIVDARTPGEALAALEAFDCNLTRCKRGTNAYNFLKHFKDLLETYRYTLITEHYGSERHLLIDLLARFDRVYRERKRQAGLLDFADLEEYAVRLLREHPDTRERLRAQFDHVLMDEFQDTNPQQYELLRLVRPPDRFYAVGDINQSIFGFRHAEPANFESYRQEVESAGRRVVELADNFRSRADILRAVETISDGAPGIERRPLSARRAFDEPRPVAVELTAVLGGEATEARLVARRIGELAEFEFKDIAVLVRNTEVLGEFTAAFEEAGIPYVVNRGRGFYESREVNDLTHLLRAIANPRDEISLATVLRSPLAGVSDEALLRLKSGGENLGAALARTTEDGFGEEDARRLAWFRERLHEWRLKREYVSFDRLLLAAMDDCGYRGESGARGAANIEKFLAQAREASGRVSLDEFVEEVGFLRASNPREPDAPPEDSANAVQVMTVHSAKGLEYRAVFVAALHKGIETGVPAVAFSPKHGLGARWRNPAVREDKDDVFQHAIRDERRRRESQESQRLLYVAMTRAQELLVLSFSNAQKPAHWAGDVTKALELDVSTAREEVAEYRTPEGAPWNLRVVVTDGAAGRAGVVRRADAAPEAAAPAAEIERRSHIGDQHETNASVTDLALFAACPREYYLARYIGFEGRPRKFQAEPEEELPAAELGSQVHALLAGTPVPDAHPEAARLAEVFRRSTLGRRAERAGRAEREFAFLMSIEDLVISGSVDLWFEEGGEVVIVDYKTDAVKGMEAHQRAGDYTMQLRLYAMAVEQAAGRAPARAYLHFLRPDTLIEVDLRPSLLESPEQLVRDFQEAQDTLKFSLNETGRCGRCPFYRDLCPGNRSPAVAGR